MKGFLAAVLAVIAVVQLVAEPARAVTCGDVNLSLAPCVSFLTGQQTAPAAGCCDGVRRLKTLAATTADRQFACGCVKQAAAHFENLKDAAVNSLPRLCGTSVRRLKTLAATTADRQFACGCVKQAAAHFENLKDAAHPVISGSQNINKGRGITLLS